MGKQINYWMDYDNFLLVAQKAVDLGCFIIKEDALTGKIIKSKDIGIIKEDRKDYYFYLAEAGDIETRVINGRELVKYSCGAGGNCMIEAGYSYITNSGKKKEISRARLYCISGYYDESGEYIERPESLTKVYHSLARFVKKVAPYTELTDVLISSRDENYGEKIEYKHKEYVTESCLKMRNEEGYRLLG